MIVTWLVVMGKIKRINFIDALISANKKQDIIVLIPFQVLLAEKDVEMV